MRKLVTALLFLPLALQAQDEYTFRSKVQLVQVDVAVSQKKTGRNVGSLTRDDFEIYEDGVKQQIAEISRDQLPLSVVLLFDLTDSVRPVLRPLAAGALNSLEHLKPEDEVAVMVYAGSADLVQDFTTDRTQTVTAIQKASETKASSMKGGEEAYFNEAIYQASQQLGQSKNPKSRRVIIWLTDNVPNIPHDKQHSEDDAMHAASDAGAVISALVERSAMSDAFLVLFAKNPLWAKSRSNHPPGNVHKYAEATGGEVLTTSKEDVAAKLAQLIDEIRSRYTLGYYPSTKQQKGKLCAIKAHVSDAAQKREGQLVLRARQGYYRR